jgi:hypothetical protein
MTIFAKTMLFMHGYETLRGAMIFIINCAVLHNRNQALKLYIIGLLFIHATNPTNDS